MEGTQSLPQKNGSSAARTLNRAVDPRLLSPAPGRRDLGELPRNALLGRLVRQRVLPGLPLARSGDLSRRVFGVQASDRLVEEAVDSLVEVHRALWRAVAGLLGHGRGLCTPLRALKPRGRP
jgi:hypothetical protein